MLYYTLKGTIDSIDCYPTGGSFHVYYKKYPDAISDTLKNIHSLVGKKFKIGTVICILDFVTTSVAPDTPMLIFKLHFIKYEDAKYYWY